MIVIASDGLFDVMSNEDVVKFIYDMMGGNDDDGGDGRITMICQKLLVN